MLQYIKNRNKKKHKNEFSLSISKVYFIAFSISSTHQTILTNCQRKIKKIKRKSRRSAHSHFIVYGFVMYCCYYCCCCCWKWTECFSFLFDYHFYYYWLQWYHILSTRSKHLHIAYTFLHIHTEIKPVNCLADNFFWHRWTENVFALSVWMNSSCAAREGDFLRSQLTMMFFLVKYEIENNDDRKI